MPYYVICGKPDCPGFAHAIHVAQHLNKHLPRFEYQKIVKNSDEWGPYINSLNKKNRWHVIESPLIWKEISMWGGKKYLIGGLSEFWEYVYCYYGLESAIPKDEILKLAEDNLTFYKQQQAAAHIKSKKQYENQRIISILGVCKQTPILILELLKLNGLRKDNEILIKLFDTLGGRDTSRSLIINNCDFTEDREFTVVESLESALDYCDVLIYMYDLSQKMGENEYEWLSRVFCRMQIFSDNVNTFARRDLKLILNCFGPSCFMASILLEYCTRLRPSNIVVITADQGLSMLNIISEKTGIRVDQLSAPPVWGFIGVNSYVDENNIILKANMYRPYKRALTAPPGATLPLGTIKCELRTLSYLLADIDHDEVCKIIEKRKNKAMEDLGYRIGLSKVRAVVSLLKEWYADVCSNNIISLGIYSDGSFGIPTGMVFSQPVKLDDSGKWIPYTKFPLMDDKTREHISKYSKQAKQICDNYIIPRTDYNIENEEGFWEENDEYLLIQSMPSDQSFDAY